jgi:hypothetical protein
MYDVIWHFLKLEISHCQHGFSKCMSPITNLVTYIHFIFPLVSSQRQVDSLYFHVINAFDLVPHSLLLRKLSAFGLFGGYVIWFRSYLSNRKSYSRVPGIYSSPIKVLC